MRRFLLQSYRLAVLLAIAWLVRDLAIRQRTQGHSPIAPEEVRGLLPGAARLRPDSSARDGLFVLDATGRELGYVVRTQPRCQDIIGYCGVTDALVVLGPDWKILGIRIHASDDTREHVHDIEVDRRFLKKWNGLTWDEAANLDFRRAGIEGVSGATMTSMAIAHGVKQRLRQAQDEMVVVPFQFGWRDAGLVVVVITASLLAFGPVRWRQRWRTWHQVALVGYLGLVSGDLLAVKLFSGWVRAGVPWTTAPGLVLLGAAALLIPWATRSPWYCHHVCPHGAAQDLLHRIWPGRRRWEPPAGVVRGLSFLPFALLAFALVVTLLALPFELTGIEPFDAYVFRTAGMATIGIAVVGLIASVFVPQAYCRFGCPTGALLAFGRSRGTADRFSVRDGAALALLGLALLVQWQYLPFIRWVQGLP